MLININIIEPEKINIIILTKQAYIEFYKIIIFIKIWPCSSQQVYQIVYIKTIIIILSG